MRIRILAYTICIFLIILLQSTVFDYIKIFNVKPNLIIVFVVSVALLRGNVEGAIIGFVTGLCQDMISGKLLGLYSLLGLYLGLIIGSVNKRLYRENFFVIIFFAFISTVVYESIVYLLTSFRSIVENPVIMLFPFKNIILPEAVYNSIISILIYILVIKLNDSFEDVSKASRKY